MLPTHPPLTNSSAAASSMSSSSSPPPALSPLSMLVITLRGKQVVRQVVLWWAVAGGATAGRQQALPLDSPPVGPACLTPMPHRRSSMSVRCGWSAGSTPSSVRHCRGQRGGGKMKVAAGRMSAWPPHAGPTPVHSWASQPDIPPSYLEGCRLRGGTACLLEALQHRLARRHCRHRCTCRRDRRPVLQLGVVNPLQHTLTSHGLEQGDDSGAGGREG